MKKYLLSLLFVLCAVAAQAQDVRIPNQYFITNDTNPTTQVWSTPLGQFVANSDATFATWLNANDGRADRVCNVQGSANNGSGKLRVTCGTTSNIQTGQVFNYCGNLTGCAGAAAGTVVDATHLDFLTVAYSGTADTGGVVWSATVIDTSANLYTAINSYNTNIQPPSYLAVSSSANYQMANTPPLVFQFTPTVAGLSVTLPKMNVPGSLAKGRRLFILNGSGSTPFALLSFGGFSLANTPSVGAGAAVEVDLIDNSVPSGAIVSYASVGRGSFANGDGNATLVDAGGPVTPWATSATLTAARTWTLPAANASPGNTYLLVADRVGGVSATNTLSVARAGSDTINGGIAPVVLNRAYDWTLLMRDGGSKWTVVGGHGALASTDLADLPIPVSSGGSGAASLTGILLGNGTGAFTTLSYTAPTTYSPTDQSGAGLTFTGIDFNYRQEDNVVYLYGTLTYPAACSCANDNLNATISLPVAVPNVARAQTPAQVGNNGGVTNLQILPVQGTSSPGMAVFRDFTTGAAKHNGDMAGTRVRFMLIYPVS